MPTTTESILKDIQGQCQESTIPPSGALLLIHVPEKEVIEKGLAESSGLLAACKLALNALVQLSCHHAFADDAPEFNEGGCGYEASEAIKRVLRSIPYDDDEPNK